MKIEKIIEMLEKGEIEEAKYEIQFLNELLEHLQETFKKFSDKRKEDYDKDNEIGDYASHLAYQTSYEFLKNTLKEI